MAGQALIVVDMHNGFLREGNLASDRCLDVLPAVVAEVERALAAGQRVIFTADTHEGDDAEFKIFPVHCVRGSREAELVDELQRFLGHPDVNVVAKRRYSALFETELEGLLHRHGIDSVRICGVCTDICVLHTTADLRNRDIAVTVVAAGTATFDAPEHGAQAVREQALAHMAGILGEVLGEGLGVLHDLVLLPHARRRLRVDDQVRMSVLARRFEPARCLVLDDELRVDLTRDGGLPADARVIAGDGRVSSADAA
jgi:nicotinamidase/pyrazinamidase